MQVLVVIQARKMHSFIDLESILANALNNIAVKTPKSDTNTMSIVVWKRSYRKRIFFVKVPPW